MMISLHSYHMTKTNIDQPWSLKGLPSEVTFFSIGIIQGWMLSLGLVIAASNYLHLITIIMKFQLIPCSWSISTWKIWWLHLGLLLSLWSSSNVICPFFEDLLLLLDGGDHMDLIASKLNKSFLLKHFQGSLKSIDLGHLLINDAQLSLILLVLSQLGFNFCLLSCFSSLSIQNLLLSSSSNSCHLHHLKAASIGSRHSSAISEHLCNFWVHFNIKISLICSIGMALITP